MPEKYGHEDYPLPSIAIMEDEWYSGQGTSADIGGGHGGDGGAMGVGGRASAAGRYGPSFTPPNSHGTPGMMPGQVCTAVL